MGTLKLNNEYNRFLSVFDQMLYETDVIVSEGLH